MQKKNLKGEQQTDIDKYNEGDISEYTKLYTHIIIIIQCFNLNKVQRTMAEHSQKKNYNDLNIFENIQREMR